MKNDDIEKWLGVDTREGAALHRISAAGMYTPDVAVLAECAAEMTKNYISLISTDPKPPDGDTEQNLAFYKAMAKFGKGTAVTITVDDQHAILNYIECLEYFEMHSAKLYADQVRTIHALLAIEARK